MSAIPTDQRPTSGPATEGIWQHLATALEAYFARRRKGAVSATLLRRSSYELARCRLLMHRSGPPADAGFRGSTAVGGGVDHA
jgi:hypothetical protein